jgi:nucleotide-binding universal stress UspA family protein
MCRHQSSAHILARPAIWHIWQGGTTVFRRVIVATDLSPSSYPVVKCLGGLRAYGVKRCLLLLCLSVQEVTSVALSDTSAYIDSTLQAQKDILEQTGYSVETRVVEGFVRRELNRIAAEEDYALIVIGSRGHSMTGEAFLGGVAYDVIHHACKPVLLVRLKVTPAGGHECVRADRCDFGEHVLFPTDFSETADLAFTYVQALVADGAKRVTLLHVQDQARFDPHLLYRLAEFNEIDRGRLERMKEVLQRQGDADIGIELCYGSPFAEIIRRVRERAAHLVVMGNQGRGFVKELFLGSVSHNVARHSDAAVLLIPAMRDAG